MPDATDNIGPHLLGRVPSPPDDRDWKMADYLVPAPDDALLGKTVQQVLDEGTFFSSWAGLLIFWRWLRKHLHPSPKPPSPPPPIPWPPIVPSGAVSWHDATQLDQSNSGHCVGFGWAAWADCAPIEDHYGDADGHALYYECKVIDGEPYAENGSTVRSGAKAMKNRGRLGAYVFASTETEVKQWVVDHGPVVIGSDWYDGFFQPDVDGIVRPFGPVVGGHAYLLLGYDPATDLFEFENSWGSSWGKHGRFYMTAKVFTALVFGANANGEACAGVELP